MDKNVLIEYADMKMEIKDLRRRIEDKQNRIDKLHTTVMSDTVTMGKKGRKSLGTVKVTGIPDGIITRMETALEKNRKLLELREVELLELQNDVEEYIESIPKSEMRTMLRLYFVDDMTCARTAAHMNYLRPTRRVKYTDENIKKKIQRFFENVPQCPEER
jgi:hypothetical protein